MKLTYGLLFALCAALLAAQAPVAAQERPAADPKAEALRKLLEKHQSRIVTLTWVTRASAMGQEIETPGSTTGILLGEKGLVAVSAQPFAANPAGLAGMFGGGRRGGSSATGPEAFKVNTGGTVHDALAAHEDTAVNMRFFAAKTPADKPLAHLSMPEKVSVPALGEEVVVLGAYDANLNHARFFKTARINSVIEDGKYYGLDGSVQDCLGALVVTLAGDVLGIVGQKTSGQPDQGQGGIGALLGGMSDPARMLGNRVLMTPAVFLAAIKKAQEKVNDPNFGAEPKPEPKPEAKPEPKPEPTPEEKPVIEEKPRNWRGLTKVISANESALRGKYGEAKGGIMVSAKPDTDSMCDKAGLRNGDLIIKVGDTAIAADCTVEKFWETIEKTEGVVKIVVIRYGGKQYDLEVHTK